MARDFPRSPAARFTRVPGGGPGVLAPVPPVPLRSAAAAVAARSGVVRWCGGSWCAVGTSTPGHVPGPAGRSAMLPSIGSAASRRFGSPFRSPCAPGTLRIAGPRRRVRPSPGGSAKAAAGPGPRPVRAGGRGLSGRFLEPAPRTGAFARFTPTRAPAGMFAAVGPEPAPPGIAVVWSGRTRWPPGTLARLTPARSIPGAFAAVGPEPAPPPITLAWFGRTRRWPGITPGSVRSRRTMALGRALGRRRGSGLRPRRAFTAAAGTFSVRRGTRYKFWHGSALNRVSP